MEGQIITLDIRPVPVQQKHPTIFRAFDGLGAGGTLLLINDHDPKPLYYQFAAERNGQFEWNYVERGPQVWKVEIGKKGECGCGHRHFIRATDALREDHKVIEKVLDGLQRLTERPEVGSLESRERAVDFIRNFADRCHHLKEEGILFPLLESHGLPREGGPVGVMLLEHDEGRGYVKAMAEALADEKSKPGTRKSLVENATAYVRLLRQHILKEDQILFTMADDSLSPKEQKELLREFEEHEAKEMGAGVHEKYLKIAEELEG